jgi:DnaJ-class molecular chaperone
MVSVLKKRKAVQPTLYAVLGMPPGTGSKDLHARYLDLAFELHPDRHGDEDKFKSLTAAWGTLKDPATRRIYDQKLKMEGNQCSRCLGSGISYGSRLCGQCLGTGQKS